MPKASVQSSISVEIMKVTKKQAKEWLETNEVNRSLRTKVVAAYRRDMEDGHWSFTAEPIQISRTGRLLNGQHRLTALAGANSNVRSIDFLVASGLDDNVQSMMDQGVARRLTDALSLSHGHVKNVTSVASLCRWLTLAPELTGELSHSTLRGKVTTAEALTTFDANPDIPHAVERGKYFHAHVEGSPTALSYVYLHMYRVDESLANEFWAGMIDMEWKWKNDPRKAALRRIQAIHRDGEIKTSLETGFMLISLLSRAWNHWRKEEEIEALGIRHRGGIIPAQALVS